MASLEGSYAPLSKQGFQVCAKAIGRLEIGQCLKVTLWYEFWEWNQHSVRNGILVIPFFRGG